MISLGHAESEVSQGGYLDQCSCLPSPPSTGLCHLQQPQEPPRTCTPPHFKVAVTLALQASAWASLAHLAGSRAQGALTCPAAVGSLMPCALAAGDPPRLARLWGRRLEPGSAAWRSGAAQRALEAWGGRRGAGWLVLSAPGGVRAGNVACAPGNAPIALTQRRSRSVWSLLALMESDSAAGDGQGWGRGSDSGGGGLAPGDSRNSGAHSLPSKHGSTRRSVWGTELGPPSTRRERNSRTRG